MKIITCLTAFLLTANLLFAHIINVPADYPTIQQGIDAADDGDTVLVNIGTYFENINFHNKTITVASHYLLTLDTSYISQTILDGNSQGSVVLAGFGGFGSVDPVLSGFTVRNGKAVNGGGISCGTLNPEGKLYLDNLIIENNVAEELGGGIYCQFGKPIIRNVIIRNNIAGWGSGVACEYSSPVIQNALFYNNLYDTTTSWTYGASVLNGDCGSKPKLINVTITENVQSRPEPFGEWVNLIACDDSLIITNSVIYNNGGGGYSVIGADYLEISYSNVEKQYGEIWQGEGNINEDPMFVMSDDHPYQINDYSPCIDAGTPDTSGLNLPELDLAGNPRLVNNRIDMGAYEWNIFVGVEEPVFDEPETVNVSIYPNPITSTATLSGQFASGETVNISIYNTSGSCLKNWEFANQQTGQQEFTLNLSNLPPGIYFLRLQAGNEVVTKKIIKI